MPELSMFTKEEIEVLRNNPYVLRVGENKVRFTSEFKKSFWKMYIEEDIIPREIIRRMGLDPNMLGQARIRSIPVNLKKEYDKYGEFSDFRRRNASGRKEKAISDIEVSRLRAEVAYLRQERDFLKKIVLAGKGEKQK